MVATSVKTTIQIPLEIKEMIESLKTDKIRSVSAVISAAVREYKLQQEIKRWERSYELASKDEEILRLEHELAEWGVEDYVEY
ncbi:MAG: hypothetical protein CR967_05290 [Proteobacteria bacterium]|nr:MAG: hypothetical protein CR967_05290 [Pseudomonadota bacterium]